ncbi:hypothetical protein ATL39_2986 [Sinobaca qinghaiensis]|uniref:Uncharacterized protein n=1 Tax=Sinobaca qinghaiensis TaxID=342944 RepID=A0A419UWR8_9BACL|nr:hypothetical protein [Sinobaca qinghaiensis]RKD69566.1 hypothetical protein ATL39_2986 [Sinobaca qinghaiensis]
MHERTIGSIGLAILSVYLLFHFFFSITSTGNEGVAVFFPLISGPVGFALAWKVYKEKGHRMALIGALVNGVLFFFPFLYMMLGTMILGV